MWTDDFLVYLRCQKGCSPHTLKAYGADLLHFEEYFKSLDENLDWAHLDEDVVRGWLMAMMAKGNSPASIRRRRSSIRTFYNFLLRRECVQRNPSQLADVPKLEKKIPVYVREGQMDRLLDDVRFPDGFEGMRDRAILLTFYSTGLRLSELVGLSLCDIDNRQCMLRVIGKRNKQRIVPYGKELQESLSEYLRERVTLQSALGVNNDTLYINIGNALPMKPSKVRNIVKYYLGMVTTLKKRSPHVLRHSFATSMLNHHADLQSVKALLGHESLATTEIYTHATFEELITMYNTAHPRATK